MPVVLLENILMYSNKRKKKVEEGGFEGIALGRVEKFSGSQSPELPLEDAEMLSRQ